MLGERLKNLRELHNMQAQELSEKLGVNKSTISLYEHGVRHPSLEKIIKLANIFGVSVDYLVGHEPDEVIYRKIESALADEPELQEFFENLKDRQDLKQLFQECKDLPPETARKIVGIIKVLESEK